MGIFKNSRKLFGSLVVASIFSFFLCISINVICTAVFTKESGYFANVYAEDSVQGDDPVEQYTYNFADGEDEKLKQYEADGYIVEKTAMRSVLSGKGYWIFIISSQAVSLIMVLSFAASQNYKQGFADANLVRTGHKKRDILKGLKIGSLANVPFFAMFALLIIMALGLAPQFKTSFYGILNGYFYPVILVIAKSADVVSRLNFGRFALLFALQLIVPAVSQAAYMLGYYDKEIKKGMQVE